ncbi:hypothetical protein [Chitinophaga skermanii]|nr:hypothetical protein [Chitinophaga skermanii]
MKKLLKKIRRWITLYRLRKEANAYGVPFNEFLKESDKKKNE